MENKYFEKMILKEKKLSTITNPEKIPDEFDSIVNSEKLPKQIQNKIMNKEDNQKVKIMSLTNYY